MAQKPLIIPFILDPSLPTSSPNASLPINPSHVVSWIIPSNSEAGPSRRTAIACPDNTIWIHTTPSPQYLTKGKAENTLSPGIPSITTQAASSLTSPTSSPRRNRPGQTRNLSYSGRPRNVSSASSVYSTTSGSGKRRTSAFSPPPSTLQFPTTTLSSVSTSVAPPDVHAHRTNISDRNELRESLEKHKERKGDSNSGSIIGLGIGGIGRRGLIGLQNREEHDKYENERSGATSPKSIISTTSTENTSTTGGAGRFGFFSGGNRNSISTENESDKDVMTKEKEDKIQEIKVDLEMEKESREDQKELEDRKLIENAIIERSPTPTITYNLPTSKKRDVPIKDEPIRRIILRDVGKGKIVKMKVFEDADSLVILRDEGLLDIFSLTTLERTAIINLETPEDTKASGIATSSKSGLKIPLFWLWKNIHLTRKYNVVMYVAHGLPWPCDLPSPNGEVTRAIMISHSSSQEGLKIVARLELPGEGDIGICDTRDSNYLIHSTPTSLTSYPIIFPTNSGSTNPTPSIKASPQMRAVSSVYPSPYVRSSTPDPTHQRVSDPSHPHSGLRKSASYTHLKESASTPLLDHPKEEKEKEKEKEHGFAKFLARRDWTRKGGKEDEKPEEPSPGIGEGKEIERDGGGGWDRIVIQDKGDAVGWKDGTVDVFWTDGKKLNLRGSISLPKQGSIQEVYICKGWKSVVVQLQYKTCIYRLKENNQDSKSKSSNLIFEHITDANEALTSSLDLHGYLCTVKKDTVELFDISRKNSDAQQLVQLKESGLHSGITHIASANIESVFTSDPQGNIASHKFAEILDRSDSTGTASDHPTTDRLDSPVTCLTTIVSDEGETVKEYLVAGDEDGAIRVWTTNPFKLCGSFTLFADPVKDVRLLDVPQAGQLRGCLLVTSREGTVGIISLKAMDDLFLIPASRTPLRRIFIEQKDILLAYANGKARVWNTKTQEFRRSTGLDAAEEMLQVGDWTEVLPHTTGEKSSLSSIPSAPTESNELGRLLNLDLRDFGQWLHSSKNNPNHSPLSALRSLLSVFLTFGVDDKVDEVCINHLGIHRPVSPILVGQSETDGSQFTYAEGVKAWNISPTMTGLRQLVIVTLLRPFLDSPDHERWAAEAIAYYTASLPPTAIEPDLQFFAEYYMDSSTDVHQAARMLFAARVGRMSNEEIDATIEIGHANLPSKLTPATRSSDVAANALTMLGGIALHKFETVQASTLKSIAESVSIFLNSTSFTQISLAIEICSKGFTTWQSYIDPFELLRRLFYLSTNKDFSSSSSSSGGINSINISAQARIAVLNVATTNPALFMSTLSMDILDAKTVEGRTSIMKLCVFMSRKKPNLLENGLPKIAEAIVKSLDPNIGKMRDDVWQAATVILNELVLAFSTIDFHSGTQRLVVGTHEGAVITYDLKTASRLYVIEPHKHPVSAVHFSPDGRRLITVSLEEGNVTVWKVGSSISGFFNVGAPPRQGGEKGEPFKRIEFIRADDGPMDSTSALSDIQISWPGNRQARIMIKETALTFET